MVNPRDIAENTEEDGSLLAFNQARSFQLSLSLCLFLAKKMNASVII